MPNSTTSNFNNHIKLLRTTTTQRAGARTFRPTGITTIYAHLFLTDSPYAHAETQSLHTNATYHTTTTDDTLEPPMRPNQLPPV